jgi:polyphosphate kinase
MMICEGDHSPELRDPPFVAPVTEVLRDQADLFAAIRERDILLHHPYDNFSSVIDFLQQAADDPNVLAIKQTLYRTGGDTRIVGALMRAVENGKQVTAVVELRARFDEANNIEWSRRLEESGVHVVYGLVGSRSIPRSPWWSVAIRMAFGATSTSAPAITTRAPPDSTPIWACSPAGPTWARKPPTCSILLTGICQFQGTRKFMVAPFQLHQRILEMIQREAATPASKACPPVSSPR